MCNGLALLGWCMYTKTSSLLDEADVPGQIRCCLAVAAAASDADV